MVDCAGPWTVRVDTGLKVVETKIHVMSIVDSWVELALIPTENSFDCAKQYNINWLCRYPRPAECCHDNKK